MIRLLSVLFLWFGSLSHAVERQLYVGRAEANITPNEPVALEGSFTLRISDGVHSPIRASVLIIGAGDPDKDKELSVIVSADLVHIPKVITDRLRDRVAQRIPGINPSRIFISATHTHQAPVVMSDNFILPKGIMTVDEYIDFFVGKVSDAVVKAHNDLSPGTFAWGLGHAQVAYNRRDTYSDGSAQVYGGVNGKNYLGPEGGALPEPWP